MARAARILNTLAANSSALPLAAISRRLSLPRSSTLALCNTLAQTGLVIREPDGSFRLGPHVLELSRAYLAQTDIHTAFDRVCAELNPLPEQTLVLSVLNTTDVVYVGRRIGSRPVGVNYELGMRLPANCTASGKALLSSLDTDRVRTLYADMPADELPTLTAKSISALPVLIQELLATSERGYAIDDEETAIGMMCWGAPVREASGHAVAAVAVSLVKAAITGRDRTRIVSEIQALASKISAALGHTDSALAPSQGTQP